MNFVTLRHAIQLALVHPMKNITTLRISIQILGYDFFETNSTRPRSTPRKTIHNHQQIRTINKNLNHKQILTPGIEFNVACSDSELPIMINILKMVAFTEGMNLVKKAIIEIVLIPEANEKLPEEIEREILTALCEGFLRIPWSYEIGKVKVIET